MSKKRMNWLHWLSAFFIVTSLTLATLGILINSFMLTVTALFNAIIGALLAAVNEDDWS